ncbi:MAG: hypothetical protein JWR63_887 [Conexibacter sp.]|nr:hypothetical protein [Conexibacter sp.]
MPTIMSTSSEAARVATIVEARAARRTIPSWLVHVGGAALLILLLARPLIFGGTDKGRDYYGHLWYIAHEAGSLQANGVPSLFAQDGLQVFNPHFAFYGGTLFAFAGVLATIFGSALIAYTVTWLLGFAAAYGGWYWLGRTAGLGPWWSHVPAALFVSSPYYLANIFLRADWPEFAAVSTIPLLVASALSVLRADRLRPLPALALALGSLLFTGSHNITLLWGTTVLVLLAATLCACGPAARRQVTRPGLLRVASVVVPAVLVNAWFLLPDIAYQSQTFIASTDDLWKDYLRTFDQYVDWGHLLPLNRAAASWANPTFALELPVLALAWAGLTVPVLRSRLRDSWTRTLLVLIAAVAALIVVMTTAGILLALPRIYRLVQFSFRIESYILLASSGAVLAALVLARRATPPRQRWAWVVVPITALSVGLGAQQVVLHRHANSTQPPFKSEQPYMSRQGMPGAADYTAHALPRIKEANDAAAQLVFDAADAEKGDRASTIVNAAPGQLVVSNVLTLPPLVHLEGARLVALVDSTRMSIMQIDANATPGAAKVTISAAKPLPVVAGQALSLLGLAGLLANGVAMARGARRRRDRAPSPPPISS